MSAAGPLRLVGAGVLLALSLSACASGAPASSAPDQKKADSPTGSFVVKWLPASLNPHANPLKIARLTWRSPTGKVGSVRVTEGMAFSGRNRNGATLVLLAARAASYPKGYWGSFLTASYLSHEQSGHRLILYSPRPQGDAVEVVFEDDGYFVQITGSKISVDDIVHFAGSLSFKSA
jgi:hypothetical protein